jgi:hypothetical protein
LISEGDVSDQFSVVIKKPTYFASAESGEVVEEMEL